MNKVKIVIAGIGGVGGYFGGLLAKAYAGNDNIEIYFVARGQHLTEINNNGLKVAKGEITFTAKPFLATPDVTEIGIADYILVCTKTYDLEAICAQIIPCVGNQTVILPLLNGVEAVEKIRNTFPENLVPAGCAYIVSAITEPGRVENMGNRQEIYFGLDDLQDQRLETLLDLLKSAGIEAFLSEEISTLIWEKLIFLSCIATASSYYNQSVGELLVEHEEALYNFINESSAIAKAKNIHVNKEVIEKAMAHYRLLPYHATSSMQRDFSSKKPQTELESITGYMVRQGKKLKVNTPSFNEAYAALLKR